MLNFIEEFKKTCKILCIQSLNEYLKICENNINTIKGDTEKHHILPKSIFPQFSNLKNNPWNGINLPYIEHIKAHVFLAKAIGGKMLYALNRMLNIKKNLIINCFDNEMEKCIIKLKKEYKELSKRRMKLIGKNKKYITIRVKTRKLKNGYNWTNSSKNKASNSKIGTTLSDYTKQLISKANKGIKKTKEHKEKIKISNTGKIHTQETKTKISNKKKGKFIENKNPAAILIYIYDSKGILKYKCHGNFDIICKNNNLPCTALRKSYYKNGEPIYDSNLVKKEILKKYGTFKGWYAIKQVL